MSIPLIDLKAQFNEVGAQVRRRIDDVLAHGQFIMGPEVAQLEQELAAYVGVRNVVSCSSGTDALLMPLMAHGIGPGDAIFTSTFTFVATAEVIALLGATPVFVDIDPDSFNIAPDALEQAVEQTLKEGRLTPRGVIAVDLFGLIADYHRLQPIADKHDLFVIEDAAQSFGARRENRVAGTFGNVAATSFFPAKPLGCYGDGGAVFTDDDELAEQLRSIRVHGKGQHKYDNHRVGLNARLDTIQAAVLLAKLEVFDAELSRRQTVAARYAQGLANCVQTPKVPAEQVSAWAQYAILTDNRDQLAADLKGAGVPSAIYYPKPLHLQSVFEELGYAVGNFPHSERASERILSLPMHPYLESNVQDTIIDAVKVALGRN